MQRRERRTKRGVKYERDQEKVPIRWGRAYFVDSSRVEETLIFMTAMAAKDGPKLLTGAESTYRNRKGGVDKSRKELTAMGKNQGEVRLVRDAIWVKSNWQCPYRSQKTTAPHQTKKKIWPELGATLKM